ncbi:MAG: hypothetical protein IT373_21190 [Polyangiaceae bacterium]|nr:hypothetical protein [Polyangiaceae bacterium]
MPAQSVESTPELALPGVLAMPHRPVNAERRPAAAPAAVREAARGRAALSAAGARLRAACPQIDRFAYAVVATVATAMVAAAFRGYARARTAGDPTPPLDEAFAHFDFARTWARGHPFAWTDDAGFSSGSAGPLYPALLALGYLLGLRGPDAEGHAAIMIAAAAIALAAALVLFSATARLLAPLGRHAKYLAPVVVCAVGSVGFAWWSGLEHALALALWGSAMAAAQAARAAPHRRSAAWRAGLLCAAWCATSPAAWCCVPVLAAWVAWPRGSSRLRRAVAAAAPATVVLGAWTLASRVLTGEWLSSHALARLAPLDPYATAGDELVAYGSRLARLAARIVEHDLGGGLAVGAALVALAALPLLARRTRSLAIALWAQVACWLGLVALDDDALRRGAEHLVVPALVWLLLLDAAALALFATERAGRRRGPRLLGVAAALALLYSQTLGDLRAAVARYGDASHGLAAGDVALGERLRALKPRLLLVDHPGAVSYATDRPALDLVGLGGRAGLPIARARRHGVGAVLELLERIEAGKRPDYLALRHGEWGELPIYFGRFLWSAPGGAGARTVYEASWRAFDRPGRPRELEAGEHVVDELDVGDLVSEQSHGLALPAAPPGGAVRYRLLGDRAAPERDLFDAGRTLPPAGRLEAELAWPRDGGRLLVRLAPEARGAVSLLVDGEPYLRLELRAARMLWQELSLPLGPGKESATLALEALDAELTVYHLWVVEAARAPLAETEARRAAEAPPEARSR